MISKRKCSQYQYETGRMQCNERIEKFLRMKMPGRLKTPGRLEATETRRVVLSHAHEASYWYTESLP
jgi:hypothetical protein